LTRLWKKNKKYDWRWSGLKQLDAIEAILDNHTALIDYISKLKEDAKKKRARPCFPLPI
jgi:hypothetical protein